MYILYRQYNKYYLTAAFSFDILVERIKRSEEDAGALTDGENGKFDLLDDECFNKTIGRLIFIKRVSNGQDTFFFLFFYLFANFI